MIESVIVSVCLSYSRLQEIPLALKAEMVTLLEVVSIVWKDGFRFRVDALMQLFLECEEGDSFGVEQLVGAELFGQVEVEVGPGEGQGIFAVLP